jgi:hypothetical protein
LQLYLMLSSLLPCAIWLPCDGSLLRPFHISLLFHYKDLPVILSPD